ncbi:MAG: hypothetical protein Q9220_002033 [cf. Caloplaca sp. 1 TL-2023]
MATLNDLVQQWLHLDQDPVTRSEIQGLVHDKDTKALDDRLSTHGYKGLSFGTAGLRAPMGAGFARLNSLTIIQTSQGLAEYLISSFVGTHVAGIVVGHDARHNSEKFAELAATVFENKGIKVWWFEGVVHTPLVPFAVKTLEAMAGIMITASHNPAQDNGYKVYDRSGCQINSPVDTHIAASITQNLEPRTWSRQASPLREPISISMKGEYFSSLKRQIKPPESNSRQVPFIYTPMHGVGFSYMVSAADVAGMKGSMITVREQVQPDPNFPTVRYPNPEEKGALDLAIQTANKYNVSLILANDPDADRFAAAEKVDNVWHQFTGDQMGALLADWTVSSLSSPVTADDVLLTSAVSSEMLKFMAKAKGFSVVETLTGFKWLGNVARQLQESGKRVHFAYEEALGYMFPELVHDKDGIAAAVIFLQASASWGSPWAKLQHLYGEYGYFNTVNTYWRSPNLQKTQAAFERVRSLGQPYPDLVGSRRVIRWRDLTKGYDSSTEKNVPDLPASASTQMITCWLDGQGSDDGIRFTVRASGTEPKIKIYLECRAKRQESAQIGAFQVLRWLKQKWFHDPDLRIEERFADF